MVPLPTNLKDAIVFFSDQDVAIEFFRDIRWPNGVECPTCGSKDVYYIKTQRRWKCKNVHPKQQFSVKVGTIFEDSPIGLDKWLPAAWLVTSCKNGMSSYELARDLKVAQRTAWFMLHRLRHAMHVLSNDKLAGDVEADETFIGGKLDKMHRRARRKLEASASGDWGKTVVMGLLRRGGGVRAAVAPNRHKAYVATHVRDNVAPCSFLATDDFVGYYELAQEYLHNVVRHAIEYVWAKAAFTQTVSKISGRC
jgi:transposase-like protein